jgi:hypothetical protein
MKCKRHTLAFQGDGMKRTQPISKMNTRRSRADGNPILVEYCWQMRCLPDARLRGNDEISGIFSYKIGPIFMQSRGLVFQPSLCNRTGEPYSDVRTWVEINSDPVPGAWLQA